MTERAVKASHRRTQFTKGVQVSGLATSPFRTFSGEEHMRRALWVAVLALAVVPKVVAGQGWVVPRPCAMPIEDRVRPPMPVACDARVVRVRSEVRAELVGSGASRVVRY